MGGKHYRAASLRVERLPKRTELTSDEPMSSSLYLLATTLHSRLTRFHNPRTVFVSSYGHEPPDQQVGRITKMLPI